MAAKKGLEVRMARVVVLGTGGTIASEGSERGAVASRDAGQLLAAADGLGGVEVEAHDVLNVNSFLLGHRELRLVAEAVAAHAARPEVTGVVVTHGTDTMEETAFLVDLTHRGDKPVAFTGAQRSADQPDTDGPANLADAIRVAADPGARGCGALIVFGGQVLPAARTRKVHTLAPQPFAAADAGPIGRVDGLGVRVWARPLRPAALPLPTPGFDTTRVDVVPVHPGSDAALARAAVAAGAAGVILAGTGSGNGNHALVEWVAEATALGVAVGLSTRAAGPVVPIYGNGGAVSLVAAGAVTAGDLPLYHARLLWALLLSAGRVPDRESVAPYL